LIASSIFISKLDHLDDEIVKELAKMQAA